MRVVSVPPTHPYVARVTASEGIHSVAAPVVAGRPAAQWWPPAALDPLWIRANRGRADALHIHFGTESFTPEHLAATIAAAHDVGWPVILTVHDIDHPQLDDQRGYHLQLAAMLPLVDAVITLTPGAAAEVERRWGRVAIVLPHPRLLTNIPRAERAPDGVAVVGMFLKDIRPNVDAAAATTELVAAIRMLRDGGVRARGRIHLHRQVRNEAAAQQVMALVDGCDEVELVVSGRLDDEELAAALGDLDACVLPYSHGTHSGWLELCWDLGVPVATPAVGFYAEQHPDASVAVFARGSADALLRALRHLLTTGDGIRTRAHSAEREHLQRLRWDAREAIDASTAAAHAELYRTLVRGRRAA